MGNRLSAIVTRTGDEGSTGLADGSRRAKDDIRVHCLGEVDELNALIGLTLSAIEDDQIMQVLTLVQHDLFDIGAELCQPGKSLILANHVDAIESAVEKFNEALPPLKEFILPGGGHAAVAAHVARSVCRRAERRMISLSHSEAINDHSRRYLNRLSDLLFVVARVLAIGGDGEVYWQKGRNRDV